MGPSSEVLCEFCKGGKFAELISIVARGAGVAGIDLGPFAPDRDGSFEVLLFRDP